MVCLSHSFHFFLVWTCNNLPKSPGTFPTCFALLWRGQTRAAAVTAPIVGMACGFAVWFSLAYHYSGFVSIDSLGGTLPCMFACLTSMFVPLPVTLVISYLQRGCHDRRLEHNVEEEEESSIFAPETVKYMKRMSHVAAFWAVLTILGHFVLWPLPMYGAKMIFNRPVSPSISPFLFLFLLFLLLLLLFALADQPLTTLYILVFHRLGCSVTNLALDHSHHCQYLSLDRWRRKEHIRRHQDLSLSVEGEKR